MLQDEWNWDRLMMLSDADFDGWRFYLIKSSGEKGGREGRCLSLSVFEFDDDGWSTVLYVECSVSLLWCLFSRIESFFSVVVDFSRIEI